MNRRQKKRKEKRYFQHLLILTKPKSTEMFEPPTQGIMDPANLLTLKSKYKIVLRSIPTTSFLIPSETSKRLFVQDLIFPSLFPRNDVSWFQSVFDEWVCFADLGMPSTKNEKIQPWQRRNEILENLNYNYFWRSQNLVSSRLQDESVFS